MIIDSLNNISQYENLNPLFSKAFEYLKSLDFSRLEVGKTELAGNDLFVTVSESKMKSAEQARLETHDAYIDIQVPISKAERFGWSSRSTVKQETVAYDPARDIQFFGDQPQMCFDVQPGNFVLFFPGDAHAPCMGEGTILKMIFKVKVS